MTREELIASLTDLKDYSIITDDAREKLHMSKREYVISDYSPEDDSRISDMFNYQNPASKGFDVYMRQIAFAVVASFADYNINIPNSSQMRRMLKISGYSAAQMKDFIWDKTTPMIAGIAVKSKAPTVYLLTRVMADAMTDADSWKAYKKGKKRKNYTQTENKSMQKLKTLVSYMEQEELLAFGDLSLAGQLEYKDFIISHAKPICMVTLAHAELDELNQATDKLIKKKEKATEQEMIRIARAHAKQSKRVKQSNAKNSTPKLPLSNPAVELPQFAENLNPDAVQIRTMVMSSAMDDVNDKQLPQEALDLIDRVNSEYEEIHQINEVCYTRIDDLQDESEKLRNHRMAVDYIPGIAVGAFQAILDGDDIYRLRIGFPIMEDFLDECNMPILGQYGVELEDEDEWNYSYPELNGKMSLHVIEDGDLVSIPRAADGSDRKITVPLGPFISRLAKRSFEPPLYIRKSIIRKFKQGGLSDRKARDYALVVAVLESVMRNEADDYYAMSEYPDNQESDLQQSANLTDEQIDQRLADELSARKQAEQDLKQARRENQNCRHEISSLQKENAALRKGLDKYKGKTDNKDGAAADNDNDASADDTTADAVENIEFPYHTKQKVVLYGGFDVFHKEIQKYLPDLRIVEVSAHIDVAPIRNADIVFLQINKTNHSNYWTVCDACRNSNVPYFHLNYASAKRCAKFMVDEIGKMETVSDDR